MTQKTILITGGSRGIGAAIARLAAADGYAVCINYRRDAGAAEHVVADIRKAGGTAISVAGDIGVEADVLKMFQTVDQQLGRLDVLVNNAAILEQQMRLETMSAARLARVMNTNVIGTFLCAREAVLRMSTRHGGVGGAIVNVSSAAARLGSAFEYIDYAASKGAIDTMTIGLAREVAEEGIRVNAVRPGPILTEMHASGGEPGRVDRVKDGIPLKRGGTPDEVARAVLWLASDDASYSTGAILDVSGGR
ncbi:SDR family oxidoreductase [Pigmentiphaga aceris]|uniref:SDR family oxidoreductase n=1 Tax=Pigmentiphaga aceris TaxID=1940612 RepID=A0A5C0B207_9BURK|nr:SDR family oxidoreductase [Pigmentiphaga aceris]QEI07753.1 SDR family oxidoreductase [Pigmentiphaga aceris]